MSDLSDEVEKQLSFRQQKSSNIDLIFAAKGSAGRNPVKLAQILAPFDYAIKLMGWQDRPLADLTSFLVNYQASIDAKYHDDFKEIKIADEIERKRSERKGISIMQGQDSNVTK